MIFTLAILAFFFLFLSTSTSGLSDTSIAHIGPFFKAILTIYELISVYSFRYVYKYIFTRRRVMCSEGVARDWGTLVLPLAASQGQKVGGVPLGDLEERGTKSASVSHPNTKLQREWQWARITTACTSSASDQHCSPAFSSVWRAEAKTNTHLERGNEIKQSIKVFIFFFF